jgi:hypothetical protein
VDARARHPLTPLPLFLSLSLSLFDSTKRKGLMELTEALNGADEASQKNLALALLPLFPRS